MKTSFTTFIDSFPSDRRQLDPLLRDLDMTVAAKREPLRPLPSSSGERISTRNRTWGLHADSPGQVNYQTWNEMLNHNCRATNRSRVRRQYLHHRRIDVSNQRQWKLIPQTRETTRLTNYVPCTVLSLPYTINAYHKPQHSISRRKSRKQALSQPNRYSPQIDRYVQYSLRYVHSRNE